jgi:hypothetical protein
MLGFKLGEVLVGLQDGTTDTPEAIKTTQGRLQNVLYVWNPSTLAFEVASTDTFAGTGGSASTDEATRVDVVSSTTTYVGKAAVGSATSASVWKIQRLTSNAEGDLTVEYATGAATYLNVWDNRASLSYS